MGRQGQLPRGPQPTGAAAEKVGGHAAGETTSVAPGPSGKPTPAAQPRTHFFGSVKVDLAPISRDVSTIAHEVLQHLASLRNSQVVVTVEIEGRVPGGVPEKVLSIVSENCEPLKLPTGIRAGVVLEHFRIN